MAKKIVFLMVEKSTGNPFYVSMPLAGTKHYKHLIKAVKKAHKGARIVDYRVDN